MSKIHLLTEKLLRSHVAINRSTIDVIEEAFRLLATEDIIMPPVMSMELPMVNGEVDVKTAYVPGLPTFTIKASPGFFDNPSQGLPSLNGLMVVFCAQTGVTKAILLDNGYLTDVRTAAAGGVAARLLAPKSCETLGVIGSGVQAKLQTIAFTCERQVEQILVWGRTPEKAEKLAAELRRDLNKPVEVKTSRKELVMRSQAVITTTPAQEPLIEADWLHPGLHITAMGSDSPVKNEIAPEVLLATDKIVLDDYNQSMERGELRSVREKGLIVPENNMLTLGAICAGQVTGRESEDDITLCDLTGTGIQDTAIANAVWQSLQHEKTGYIVDTEENSIH